MLELADLELESCDSSADSSADSLKIGMWVRAIRLLPISHCFPHCCHKPSFDPGGCRDAANTGGIFDSGVKPTCAIHG